MHAQLCSRAASAPRIHRVAGTLANFQLEMGLLRRCTIRFSTIFDRLFFLFLLAREDISSLIFQYSDAFDGGGKRVHAASLTHNKIQKFFLLSLSICPSLRRSPTFHVFLSSFIFFPSLFSLPRSFLIKLRNEFLCPEFAYFRHLYEFPINRLFMG